MRRAGRGLVPLFEELPHLELADHVHHPHPVYYIQNLNGALFTRVRQ